MITTLRQVAIDTTAGLHLAHETALKLAGFGGWNFLDQVAFGAGVAELAMEAYHEHKTIVFSLETEGNDNWLIAAIEGTSKTVRKLAAEPVILPDDAIRPLLWKGREELEQQHQDMEQFTFAISHDLKNSLTKLKLALSLVEEEEMPAIIHHYIQIIHRSAERLEKTMMSLNQIIEMGHSTTSTIRHVSAVDVFNDVQDEFMESLARISASVRTNFDTNASLHYVEIYLRSVFANLLSNAIKYRSPEKALELDVSVSRLPEGLLISFSDNGIGIDMDKFGKKLFQPFTRFAHNSEGSGIGLYLIKNMVERNGGRIELKSSPGAGTSYRILLQEYDVNMRDA